MSERSNRFADELEQLIVHGDKLHMAIQHECYGETFEARVNKMLKGDKQKIEQYLKLLPSFTSEYQRWYSKAQAVVKQVLPDRLSDFLSYYEYPRVRKDIIFENYMVRDYLQGLQITRWGETTVDGSAAIPEFVQQLNIVKSAKAVLDSTLMDLKAILQADIFDSEIETAGVLAKNGYLRAAGAICGVVIEKHLLHVCKAHSVAVRKKNPSISDLNQLLKDKGITTVPQWRFIQHLADIRNICDHAKGSEPTKDEISDLVTGTEKVLKTVF